MTEHRVAHLQTGQVWYEKQEKSLLDTAASNLRLTVSQQLQEQGIKLQCTASIGQILALYTPEILIKFISMFVIFGHYTLSWPQSAGKQLRKVYGGSGGM